MEKEEEITEEELLIKSLKKKLGAMYAFTIFVGLTYVYDGSIKNEKENILLKKIEVYEKFVNKIKQGKDK